MTDKLNSAPPAYGTHPNDQPSHLTTPQPAYTGGPSGGNGNGSDYYNASAYGSPGPQYQQGPYGPPGGQQPPQGYYPPGPGSMGYQQQGPMNYGPGGGYPPPGPGYGPYQQGPYQQGGYYGQQGYYQNQRRGDGFAEALLASLACCCCLDACLLF